jgi:hypothetical protein
MLRGLLCPSSGALDYMYAIAAYGVQCCKGEKIQIVLSSVMYVQSFVVTMLCVSLGYEVGRACQLCGR